LTIGLYIHIPFCIRKCNYCDFVSYPDRRPATRQAYLAALEQEMAYYRQLLPEEDLQLETLYLGGGTPTCLSTPELRRVFKASRLFFTWRPGIEVTVEANPGTVDRDKMEMLKEEGVNRLSIGAQSFHPEELLRMGRVHGVEEIRATVELARQAGFDNISLDLIYGLPGQTLADWRRTLREALALAPEHLSAYGLNIEPGTPWGEMAAAGQLIPAGEETARAMYDEVRELCAARGYQHYEISNYARPGYQCRHNLRYWLMEPYLGLGAAASSYYRERRWTNVEDLSEYRSLLERGKPPVAEEIRLDRRDLMAETVFLGLRTLPGVSMAAFQAKFGVALPEIFGSQVEKLIKEKLIIVEDGHLRLTPFGLPVANLVFQEFI